jgi:hypothetical protein
VPRTQTLVVALSLGLAAAFGVLALTKTVHLGQAAAAKPVSERLIAKRNAELDRFEASLRAQLRKRPPAVPKLPSLPVAAPAAATPPASAQAAPQRVVYVRPAPIIVHKHRAGGEHEAEGPDHGDGSRGEGGGDD